MSALARTDVESAKHFMDGTKELRSAVIEYVRSKTDNFSAPIYFARRDEKLSEEFREWLKLKDSMKRADRVAGYEKIQKRREDVAEATPPLDLSDLPTLEPRRESVGKTVTRIAPELGLSVLFGAVVFALSFAAFIRYDAR